MRSGVNWTRPEDKPSARAAVETKRVLASPGTPMKRQWPCAKRATIDHLPLTHDPRPDRRHEALSHLPELLQEREVVLTAVHR
jgi:hypothetical protein